MRLIAAALVLCLSAGAASAQSCTAQATEKKLAGAAKTSFLTKWFIRDVMWYDGSFSPAGDLPCVARLFACAN